MQHRRIGYTAALSIVVANMIGTGVFTSLGFQVVDIRSGFALLALWIVGGVMALSGALSYAELSAALPRSGGEYHYLSRIYHPLAGLLGGWISVAVGFAAPIALAAMALGRYGAPLLGIPAPVIAAAAVLLVTGVHVRGVQRGKDFQVGSTAVKFGLIVLFIGAASFSAARRICPLRLSRVPGATSFPRPSPPR